MNVLGINIGHDTSSALIKNGKVVAACEQERYNKKKHTNEFPLDAIKDCLRIGKLKISDLDIVSVDVSSVDDNNTMHVSISYMISPLSVGDTLVINVN